MNPVVKAQLSEFSQKNDTPGYLEPDYFEVYSIYSVMNGGLNHNVNPFDVHLKGEEFGLDGVGILIKGELCFDCEEIDEKLDKNSDVEFIFFQAKRSTKFEYGEIGKFIDAVIGFFTGSMKGESAQLDDLINVKDKIYERSLRKNPNIKCYYVSTGTDDKVSRISELFSTGEQRLKDLNLFGEVNILPIDASKLQNCYRLATNSNSATIDFPKCQTLPNHQSVQQAYIGYVSASEILKLVTIKGENSDKDEINQSVFFDNIRDFDASSEINTSIIEQLKNGDTSSFVFKNNGVTVVAKHINRTGDAFTVENYQIVNGCQTSNILFECRKHINSVNVPLRLIASQDEEFVSGIIIGTNKQNEVKDTLNKSRFRSERH